MCLAFPGKIIKIDGDKATIDYGVEQRIATLMNPEIKVGEYVVVQNQLVLQSVPEEQAIKSIEMWKKAIDNEK